MSTNPFASNAFTKGLADIQARANNSKAVTQRMGLGNTSNIPSVNTLTNNATRNASESERQGYRNANEALANNPMFKQTQVNDARNFTEDSRRFDAGLNFKNTSDKRANDTNRFQSSNQLEGVKFSAEAGVRSTALQANASMYGADRNLDGIRYSADSNLAGTRLQTDAQRYSADRGYESSVYNADRGVDQARIGANAQVRSSEIGAEASRFNALLSTGASIFNSSQYRPSFNR